MSVGECVDSVVSWEMSEFSVVCVSVNLTCASAAKIVKTVSEYCCAVIFINAKDYKNRQRYSTSKVRFELVIESTCLED